MAKRNRVTQKQRSFIYKRDKNRCLRCGRRELLTIDHIIPLAKEGSNHIENLQTLCAPCNEWKKYRIIDYRNFKPVQKLQIAITLEEYKRYKSTSKNS